MVEGVAGTTYYTEWEDSYNWLLPVFDKKEKRGERGAGWLNLPVISSLAWCDQLHSIPARIKSRGKG
jgi:hypothetical protein